MTQQPHHANPQEWVIGLDLGGTNIRIRLQSTEQRDFEECRTEVQSGSSDAVVQQIADIIHDLCQQHSQRYDETPQRLFVAAAAAAMLDPTGKIVRKAPNLGWEEFPFADQLSQALSYPSEVILFNDLKAATFGEFVEGAGKDFSDLVCVLVGSGVGSGFVLGGILQQGSHRVAGEFGHVKVVMKGGRLCGCGGYGCLEAYVGGHNLARILQEVALEKKGSYLHKRFQEVGIEEISPKDLEQGLQAKDPQCQEIAEETTDYLAKALADLLTVLDPGCLILGGGVLGNSPLLYQKTVEKIKGFISTPTAEYLHITQPQLGDRAGLIGAMALAKQHRSSQR
mgnify:CR=1 FL=1